MRILRGNPRLLLRREFSLAARWWVDGQLVDVIAEGMPIDRGRAIVVTKARGSRGLVRALEA